MIRMPLRFLAYGLAALALGAALPSPSFGQEETTTPIKHVVVIFDENVSFDHYFGTYPHALNPKGVTPFRSIPETPRVNNLLGGGLLDENPNSTQPFRLGPVNAVTCDQDHDYGDEQSAFDRGLMDKFPEKVGSGNAIGANGQPVPPTNPNFCFDDGKGTGIVMSYYDGNTVTALWNYAQHYAMSDNSYGTNFGPSSVGAINVASGDTGGVDTAHEANNPSVATSTNPNADITPDGTGPDGFSLTSDAQ